MFRRQCCRALRAGRSCGQDEVVGSTWRGRLGYRDGAVADCLTANGLPHRRVDVRSDPPARSGASRGPIPLAPSPGGVARQIVAPGLVRGSGNPSPSTGSIPRSPVSCWRPGLRARHRRRGGRRRSPPRGRRAGQPVSTTGPSHWRRWPLRLWPASRSCATPPAGPEALAAAADTGDGGRHCGPGPGRGDAVSGPARPSPGGSFRPSHPSSRTRRTGARQDCPDRGRRRRRGLVAANRAVLSSAAE